MTHVLRLLRLLDEQQTNYERLHDLLAKKRAAIEMNDLPALARIAQSIELLIADNNQLEVQRQEATGALGRDLGLRDVHPTVTRLLRRLPEPQKSALRDRRDRLNTTMQELRTEARTIESVLKLNVKFIDGMLRAMLNGATGVTTYDAEGASPASEPLRLLDRTA